MSVRALLAVTALTLAACSSDRSPALDVGVELFTERNLEEAQRYFPRLAHRGSPGGRGCPGVEFRRPARLASV